MIGCEEEEAKEGKKEEEKEIVEKICKTPKPDYDAWQRGEMDYMGVDSFTNIQERLNEAIQEK